ncbi:MAG TPA: class I SAM-dependent methyltransferase [Gaiellaceae bacterium]|nr:class I SAM-dependent methyltransferase [Gaiellaceae bacterium]
MSAAAGIVFHPGQGETLHRMEEAPNYNRWLLSRAAPYLGRRVLDVGAGLGTFTEQLAAGRRVVALEPDPAFVSRLRRRFAHRPNVEIVAAELESLAASRPRDRFDSIVCFNVLEHVADDEGALARMHGLLAPGGSLLLLVPAHPAAFGSIDAMLGHERRYARRPLRDRLVQAGFEVARLRHVNPTGVLGWFVASRIMRSRQIPSGPLRLFDRCVPLLAALDGLRLPLGLSLWAVARRPD